MIIMIIAPHADDEVLGCGGVINKFSKEGHRVIVLVATNAHVGAGLHSTNAVAERS